MDAVLDTVLGHGFFFWPIISFIICGYVSLYQARRIPGRRFQALVMNLCGLGMCAYGAYALPLDPGWLVMVFLLALVFQTALICTTPVRLYREPERLRP